MDCNNARLLLNFYRPPAGDLSGPEAEELEHHLDLCSECNALASAECRLDQHLGRAMRAVEVPAAVRRNILGALAVQRSAWNRRWFGRASRVAVAAALLLAISTGWYFWSAFRTREISLDKVANAVNYDTPRDQDHANDVLKHLGTDAVAPSFVNYAYLTGSPSLAELPGYPGVKVPQFVFTRESARDGGSRAVLFALDRRRFPIEDMEMPNSGQFSVAVYQPSDDDRRRYLVLYTGDSWEWLKVNDAAE
jgi:hypothetical protein